MVRRSPIRGARGRR